MPSGIFEEFAGSVGAWPGLKRLTGIIQGTQSVSEAFRRDGQVDPGYDGADCRAGSHQGVYRVGDPAAHGRGHGRSGGGAAAAGGGGGGLGTFIGQALGSQVNLVGGGMGGGAPPSAYDFGGGLGSGGLPVTEFQHGGTINRPTMALLGEGTKNPEWIFNNQQLQSVMTSAVQSGAAAGGQGRQGAHVSVHNYPSKAQAEEGAARDRQMGHTAIVNEILADLSQGEGSRVSQMIRKLQR